MGLWDTIVGLIKRDSKKYMYLPIPACHVKGGAQDAEPMEAGKHYFRIWLDEMYLKREREWFKSWHPVVHSLIKFQFGSQTVEIPSIAGSLHLKGVEESNLEKVIQLRHNLTTLMPFNGGVVEVAAGLLAMEGKNYLNSIIKVMGDLSGMLVVPELSAALSIAGPIATGIQDLLGGGSGQLHLGLHQAYTSAGNDEIGALKPGYYAAILAEEKDYNKDCFWVEESRLRYGSAQNTSKPLTGVTHMLFRIESKTERDDWRGLTTITTAFNEAINVLGNNNEQAELAMKRTIILVLGSPDLTRADRRRVALALKEEFEEAKQLGLGAASLEKISLEGAIKKRAMAMDVDMALAQPELSLEQLFDLP